MNNSLNSYLVPSAIIIAGTLVAGAIIFSQGSSPDASGLADNRPGDAPREQVSPEDINVDFDGWPSKGSPDAPVTIVEYSDFSCPFCGRFFEETLPLIERDFIDKGLVRFVYKDFVVVGGDRAAEAAHCAFEQGKFWEYHDILFNNHAADRSRWSDPEIHRGYAVELGLDANALVTCFTDRRYQDKVIESTREASANGGTGTPYFLINNRPISGTQPYSVFQSVINLDL